MPYLHAAVTTCIIWKAVVINYNYPDGAYALHTISKQRELIGGSLSIVLCKFLGHILIIPGPQNCYTKGQSKYLEAPYATKLKMNDE